MPTSHWLPIVQRVLRAGPVECGYIADMHYSSISQAFLCEHLKFWHPWL